VVMGGAPDVAELEGSVTGVVNSLVVQKFVSQAEGAMYVSLWRLLGLYRQDAARRLLVAACTWQNNPQAAVDHIRTVISQNQQQNS
jgi:hypothetical protein